LENPAAVLLSEKIYVPNYILCDSDTRFDFEHWKMSGQLLLPLELKSIPSGQASKQPIYNGFYTKNISNIYN